MFQARFQWLPFPVCKYATCGRALAQVGPDPYWGAAGLVGISTAAPGTQVDNNTVEAPFGGIAVTAFGQGADVPPARYGKSAHVNVTGAAPSQTLAGQGMLQSSWTAYHDCLLDYLRATPCLLDCWVAVATGEPYFCGNRQRAH